VREFSNTAKYLVFLAALTLFSSACSSAKTQPLTDEETVVSIDTGTGILEGTLLTPNGLNAETVALIIAGSGPTDRNGNNPSMTNNSLSLLAHGLSESGISSVRYDKRGIGKSRKAGPKESDLRFQHYIDDASSWIDYLQDQDNFKEIIVIGHSEGALIGMIASQHDAVSKFISLASPGQNLDQIIREQLRAQPPALLEQAAPIMDKLLQGEKVDDVPKELYAIFRPSVQPYMMSILPLDPTIELAKLSKPILVAQGTTDIQISVTDADKLEASNKNVTKVVIEGMNHLLKTASEDRQANIRTYNNPDLPIKTELFHAIREFLAI